VRGGQSDDRILMRPWLADTNWRTLRRDAAAYHASRIPFLLIRIHCFDPHIAKSHSTRINTLDNPYCIIYLLLQSIIGTCSSVRVQSAAVLSLGLPSKSQSNLMQPTTHLPKLLHPSPFSGPGNACPVHAPQHDVLICASSRRATHPIRH
jgi:hypothetical protein